MKLFEKIETLWNNMNYCRLLNILFKYRDSCNLVLIKYSLNISLVRQVIGIGAFDQWNSSLPVYKF